MMFYFRRKLLEYGKFVFGNVLKIVYQVLIKFQYSVPKILLQFLKVTAESPLTNSRH